MFLCSGDLDLADVFRPVKDLALQVGKVDLVKIHQNQMTCAGGSEINRCGGTQAAQADD